MLFAVFATHRHAHKHIRLVAILPVGLNKWNGSRRNTDEQLIWKTSDLIDSRSNESKDNESMSIFPWL